ncbi:hypothetical protein A1353_13730 [Methylomonas methanica]|uniref:Kazal-like domain-containing protein n=1 Tax=Methylomonas methanica TaxID=421 RepID=A0A177MEX4_METMH|nr:hypothetical protein [Methylomonas methanica]OAI04317.1 hypothetical protein A1353_13730 [Methylomonas methanica]
MKTLELFFLTAVLLSASATAYAKPTGGGTSPKPVCKTFDIPTIICPDGWTIADDLSNGTNKCTTGFIKRTFCKNVAARSGFQGNVEVINAGSKLFEFVQPVDESGEPIAIEAE